MLDDEQLNGSEEIVKRILEHPKVVSGLEKRLENATLPEFFDSSSSKKWTEFAKEDLAALLYPNICRTLNDSYQAFSYVDNVETFTPIQKFAIKYAGSLAMYFAASKIKSKFMDFDTQGLHVMKYARLVSHISIFFCREKKHHRRETGTQ